MSKITESARDEECTIRLPFICKRTTDTTVFCHISGIRFGHGTAIKTEFGAYGCSACHDAVDGRLCIDTEYSRDELKIAHYEGVFETLMKLKQKGLIKL